MNRDLEILKRYANVVIEVYSKGLFLVKSRYTSSFRYIEGKEVEDMIRSNDVLYINKENGNIFAVNWDKKFLKGVGINWRGSSVKFVGNL